MKKNREHSMDLKSHNSHEIQDCDDVSHRNKVVRYRII